jgi:hypothetical protein
MEELEYRNTSKRLHDYYINAQKSLDIEFGLSQAICKVGDIVKDSVRIILVDKISTSKAVNGSLPEPVYHGFALKKDLTHKKSENIESIYGNHLTELIKTKHK